jgi:tripartite-type tricarboxylate transporter receptor subunit TctC
MGRIRIRISLIVLLTVVLALLTCGILSAAEYPQKPVQILVGFPPGGTPDLAARALAEASKPFFPRPFTIVNKPGGGSALATSELVNSAPDGYTLGIVDISAVVISPQLQANLPYKGPDDLQSIISVVAGQMILATKADAPWKTMKDLIDYAKANPGKLRIGNAGIGTTTHFHFLSLKLAGVPMTEVPFAGSAPANTALLGGHVDGIVMNIGPVLPHVKAGKLKYLTLFTEERINDVTELKDVPTLKELGYNVITEGNSYYIAAPKGTPQKITGMLYETFLKTQKTEFFQKFARDNFLVVRLKGPAELKRDGENSYTFYADFLKKTGLMPKQ